MGIESSACDERTISNHFFFKKILANQENRVILEHCIYIILSQLASYLR